MKGLINRIRTYILKRKALKAWKETKRVKWLGEGRTEAEIKKLLKAHKVKF